MLVTDTKRLYAQDDVLPKLESAMRQASGDVRNDILAAIKERKKELRSTQPL